MKRILFFVLALVLCSFVFFYCDKEDDILKNVSLSIEMHNGHEYVDLGLPSGLKWATCNVGAESPEDYGDYFAWGETSSKSDYDWDTYKYSHDQYYYAFTKYCNDSDYGYIGFTDNKTTLDMSDDAARVNLGGSWRMPTSAEQDELREKCTWTWTTQNGTKGYKVTGPNGNSIFLPAAGYRRDSNLRYAGSYGYYWSASLIESYPSSARSLDFYSSYCSAYGYYCRYFGHTVRAVAR
jgi:hypothetical protein